MALSVLVHGEPPPIVPGQSWTKWDRDAGLSQCKPEELLKDREQGVSATGCAEYWVEGSEDSNRRDLPGALLTSLIKDTNPLDLVRQIEYHFLLGVSQVILFDNSCLEDKNYSDLETALAPYIAKSRVVLRTDYRCVDAVNIFPDYPIGGSGIALQSIALSPQLHPRKGTLILAVDDDEYVAMQQPNMSLSRLQTELASLRPHHTAQLPWRMFGSSWHVCQPPGPVVRSFVHRGPRKSESSEEYRKLATDEAASLNLNSPFSPASGKFAVLWQSAEQIQNCSTHFCGPPMHGLGGPTSGPSPQSTTAWLAHYAYQSEQHWEAKKARGRTTRAEPREGHTPPSYNLVRDETALHGLEWRIRRVKSVQLRHCLQTLFGPPPPPSTGSDGAPLRFTCPAMPHEPPSCGGSEQVDFPATYDDEPLELKVCCPCARRCSMKGGQVREALLQVETTCSSSFGRCLVLPSDTSDVWE